MSDNIKKLEKRLREYGQSMRAGLGFKHMPKLFHEAADALEAMAGEVAELNQHARLLRAAEATQANRAEAAEAERDRLAGVLQEIGKQRTSAEMGEDALDADFEGGWDTVVTNARKALKGDE